MPAIKPIPELRNYTTVLREVTEETPVFLTKNSHGRFAIVDIRAYEKLRTELALISALVEGEKSAQKMRMGHHEHSDEKTRINWKIKP